MNLLNFKWFRSLSSSKTFVKVDGEWIDHSKYVKGKITDVDGKWHTQVFCGCGNELVHSNSFLSERQNNQWSIYDYKCTGCSKVKHFNPGVIPGLIECDFNGNPLST